MEYPCLQRRKEAFGTFLDASYLPLLERLTRHRQCTPTMPVPFSLVMSPLFRRMLADQAALKAIRTWWESSSVARRSTSPRACPIRTMMCSTTSLTLITAVERLISTKVSRTSETTCVSLQRLARAFAMAPRAMATPSRLRARDQLVKSPRLVCASTSQSAERRFRASLNARPQKCPPCLRRTQRILPVPICLRLPRALRPPRPPNALVKVFYFHC